MQPVTQPTSSAISKPGRRRGIAIVYIAVSLPVLILLVSLGVDYGRVQVAKFELRRCADAAARYALRGIVDSTWLAKAQAAATDNPVDGQTSYLTASNVILGNWSNNVFTAGGTPSNAISVTASRTSSGGNAVPLLFGQVMGRYSCDIHATAIACNVPAGSGPYGLVGTSTMNFSNGAMTDSYDSSVGPYSASTATHNGSIASNGTITVSNSTTKVDGSVFAGPTGSGTVITSGSPIITGATANAAGTIGFAAAAAPASGTYTYYGAGSFSGSYTLGGGTYLVDSMTLNNASINFTGAATICINGNFNGGSGGLFAYGGLPSNLHVIVLNSNTLTFTNGLTLQADIYGPGCACTIASGANVYGRVIAQTITANGGAIHYDTSMPSVGTGSWGSNPTLVK